MYDWGAQEGAWTGTGLEHCAAWGLMTEWGYWVVLKVPRVGGWTGLEQQDVLKLGQRIGLRLELGQVIGMLLKLG